MNPLPTTDRTRDVTASMLSLSFVAVVFGACYWLSNLFTHVRGDIGSAVFVWERSIPFVEWTIVPYLSIVPFFAVSFFLPSSRDDLRVHATRLLALLAIALVCYAAFPLRFTFERPETAGLTGVLFDVLNAVDRPYNRAPSLHIGVLVVLWARFGTSLDGVARLALQGWFVLIGASVLTTYQHHVVDVPAGFLAGWLCVRWWPLRIAPTRAVPAGSTRATASA